MLCPHCKQDLELVRGEQFNVLRCSACAGSFYPHDEFQRCLEFARTLPQEQLSLDELIGTKPVAARDRVTHGTLCPACREHLEPFNYGYDSNVILGRCPVCSGLWAEPGDIERIVRYLKGHPVLDHLAEGLGDQEREKAVLQRTLERSKVKLAIPLFTFLPMSTAGQLQYRPLMTWALIGLNVLLFILWRDVFLAIAVVPAEIMRGERLYTLITHQFAHVSLSHLVGNMLFLLAFGDRVEDRIGLFRFLAIYVLIGVVAGLAHVFVVEHSTVPCLGASGAISGVMGLYLILFPKTTVRVVLIWIAVPVPAVLYLAAWFAMQMLIPFDSNIAVAAHLGGFFAGVCAGAVVRALRVGQPPRPSPETKEIAQPSQD